MRHRQEKRGLTGEYRYQRHYTAWPKPNMSENDGQGIGGVINLPKLKVTLQC